MLFSAPTQTALRPTNVGAAFADTALQVANQELLIKAANIMKARHYIVHHPEIGFYQVSYISDVLKFYATNMRQVYTPGMEAGSIFLKWVRNELPVMASPLIEISILQMFDLVDRAVVSDQTGALRGELETAIRTERGQYEGFLNSCGLRNQLS